MDRETVNYIEIFNSIDFNKIKDHPNILIAANFWESDRFGAARTCYKFMRFIDDLIDNSKTEKITFSENDQEQLSREVNTWINSLLTGNQDKPGQSELIETIQKFRIPHWPLHSFANSMIYDIYHDGFPTMKSFFEYMEGATLAPASVFVHLCGLNRINGGFDIPGFDVREAAIPCSYFSYLVHIIRDFQKDQLRNLNYFADEVILRNGLTRPGLKKIAEDGDIPPGFRNMIREYLQKAELYRALTVAKIKELESYLEPRYRLSLEIIFSLYLMVFERINPDNGTFTETELNPTPEEIKLRVLKTIESFNTNQ